MSFKCNIDDFEAFFRPHIRVRFNWDMMRAEEWTITGNVFRSRVDIGNLYMPWYYTTGGKSCVGHDAADAINMQVKDIANHIHILEFTRVEKILSLVRTFSNEISPIQITIPAYYVDGKVIVLDGNHRLSALTLSDVEFRVMAYLVKGPLDSSALADLEAWCKLVDPSVSDLPQKPGLRRLDD